MKTIIPDSSRAPKTPKGALLGWLGLGLGLDQNAEEEDDSSSVQQTKYANHARAQLLGQISDFLLANELEITVSNLRIAHEAFAGLNPGLKRRIQHQQDSGEAVNQSWLEQITASEPQGDDDPLEEFAGKLEQELADFSRTTETARCATTQYGDALEEHVGQLEASPDAGELIANLAAYARTMLERSRKAEADLRHSESEAAALRQNLDRARREAELDFLTGLPNRRSFEAELQIRHEEALAAKEPLCVAFCDIDHFKAVNDTHGHEAGDRIICVVAETLAKISAENCHIARHGGEEFVVLFCGADAHEAEAALNHAREQLAGRKLVNRKTELPFGQVTFSGGVADVFAYEDPRQALAAADEALYQAKEAGRNQVRLAEKEEASAPLA